MCLDDQSVEALVVGVTFDAVVEEAFANLPAGSRRAGELADIDGLTYAEAAEVVRVPVGTAMSRIRRARRRSASTGPVRPRSEGHVMAARLEADAMTAANDSHPVADAVCKETQ